MSLVCWSLCSNPCRIFHSSSGLRNHDFAGASLLTDSRNQLLARTQSVNLLKRPLRAVNVGSFEGNGQREKNPMTGEPSPSRELKISGTGFEIRGVERTEEPTSVALLNEVAPPVANDFGSASKEVNILDDPAGFLRYRLERKAEKVKQAIVSVEEAVAPSQFSPSNGNDVVVFFFVSLFLIFLFWVGNYLAPLLIFKETVFRNAGQNMDDNVDDPPRKPSEDEIDPADLIELPTNLMPFRPAAVAGFKAGRQRARDAEEKRRKKRAGKSK